MLIRASQKLVVAFEQSAQRLDAAVRDKEQSADHDHKR